MTVVAVLMKILSSTPKVRTETYFKLRSTTGKCEDAHFACMRDWIAAKKDPVVAKRCRSSARKYQKALERELAYLKTRPQSAEVIRRIGDASDFLQIIARDISFLSGH